MTTDRIQEGDDLLGRLRQNLQSVIYGKDECIDILIISLLAGGSVLIEDVPGVGKTTLARTLAASISSKFHRIQFTPDLLPADILGSSFYNPTTGEFKFRQGPIFCNVLLADEINRASPRTQSAMLEAMNEQQVTIEGKRYPLPKPFVVLATQNPIDHHGTYPLPESQLDRFMVQLDVGYPESNVEVDILKSRSHEDPFDKIQPVLSGEQILQMQQLVLKVQTEKSVLKYIVAISRATREEARLTFGVSPRGSLMLSRAAQAAALTQGRDYLIPDDVQRMAPYVLPHRTVLRSKSRYEGTTTRQVIADILASIKVPT